MECFGIPLWNIVFWGWAAFFMKGPHFSHTGKSLPHTRNCRWVSAITDVVFRHRADSG